MSDTYVCCRCQGIFEKPITDAEAEAQFRAEFPNLTNVPIEDTDLLCDDCFQQFSTWARANGIPMGETP